VTTTAIQYKCFLQQNRGLSESSKVHFYEQ